MRLGKCTRCGKRQYINEVTYMERACPIAVWMHGELCADCFDAVDYDRRRVRAGNSGRHDNDPSFDNVVRAMEEDR